MGCGVLRGVFSGSLASLLTVRRTYVQQVIDLAFQTFQQLTLGMIVFFRTTQTTTGQRVSAGFPAGLLHAQP